MHMKCRKQVNWKLASIVFATAATLLTVCGWYWFWEPRAPERSFAPEDLLIDQSVVPSGWELTKPSFPTGDDLCTTECATIGFKVVNGDSSVEYGGQDVYRYLSAGIAQRTFEHVYLKKVAYLSPEGRWIYQSSIAEQSHFGCGKMAGNVGVFCQWGAQYKEYIVVFGARVPPGEVSSVDIRQIEEIVTAIDARIAHYLGKPFQDPGN
jgi:hypothetical protein